jgi:hypothetical protein
MSTWQAGRRREAAKGYADPSCAVVDSCAGSFTSTPDRSGG